LGYEHAQNVEHITPTTVGARLTPQSPVAQPNHRTETFHWQAFLQLAATPVSAAAGFGG